MTLKILRLLYATSECAPWIKTGGLGDVAAGLPHALADAGVDVRVLMPAYPRVLEHAPNAPVIARWPATSTFPAVDLLDAVLPSGVPLLLLRCPPLYERSGGPYQDADGGDWPDNMLRFACLAQAAARLSAPTSPLSWQPEVLHCNDWQTALAPAYMRASGARAATLVTIHNLAFQGVFEGNRCAELGLPEQFFSIDGVEFYGNTSFLKAGIVFADRVSTVSPTYAQEIQTAPLGFGFEGLLAWRSSVLSGILNGIESDVWSPSRDAFLPARYDVASLARKQDSKRALQQRLGLALEPDVPLLGVVSRLTHQKGSDLIAALAPSIASLGAQLAVLGSGDAVHERALLDAARSRPQSVAAMIGFDEALAHLIEAGADAFLMPSRFEPCGLNQMYSQAYGTPPIAHATGGLVDSIVDATPVNLARGSATGFLFHDPTLAGLKAALERALALYRNPPQWRELQRAGMARDFGWAARAREYIDLYRTLAGTR
jgi:starch synthase